MAPGRRPEKTATIVARRIVEDIHVNNRQPGDHLPPEKDMLERYQVGRGTLREALRFLELQNVLAIRPGPGGGPVVLQPEAGALGVSLLLLLQFDRAPYAMLLEARATLEPVLVEIAAQRATEENIAELEAIVARSRELVDDPTGFGESNKEFHEQLSSSTQNSVYRYFLSALLEVLDERTVPNAYTPETIEKVLKFNEAILSAFRERDGQRAAEITRKHLNGYVNDLDERFPDFRNRPINWVGR